MSASLPSVFVVDDEENIRILLSTLIEREGFAVSTFDDGEKALRRIVEEEPDVLLTDVRMPGMDGMEVLRRAKEIAPDLPVILITAYAEVSRAVEAMKAGAHDYLLKPYDNHELTRLVHRAMAERTLKRQLRQMARRLQEEIPLREMMGPSDAVSRLIRDVQRVAQSDFSVIIIGETGSGKELIAQAIHNLSRRNSHPFIPVDCGAIPDALMESDLFGHEKGAFTGASAQKLGRFEMAQGGTLFLDEISNMPVGSQAKLLRVLQEKKVSHVGGTKSIPLDVRVLAASNQDLKKMIESTAFRRDLFYRLNEFTIIITPLRERKEDIPYLAKRFLDIANADLSKEVKGFSEGALKALLSYPWPGNVRHLRSMIRRAALLADDLIKENHLDLAAPSPQGGVRGENGSRWKGLPLKEALRQNCLDIEREMVEQAMKDSGGNKSKAARLLQVDYKTIHTKVKLFGIHTGGENGKKG